MKPVDRLTNLSQTSSTRGRGFSSQKSSPSPESATDSVPTLSSDSSIMTVQETVDNLILTNPNIPQENKAFAQVYAQAKTVQDDRNQDRNKSLSGIQRNTSDMIETMFQMTSMLVEQISKMTEAVTAKNQLDQGASTDQIISAETVPEEDIKLARDIEAYQKLGGDLGKKLKRYEKILEEAKTGLETRDIDQSAQLSRNLNSSRTVLVKKDQAQQEKDKDVNESTSNDN